MKGSSSTGELKLVRVYQNFNPEFTSIASRSAVSPFAAAAVVVVVAAAAAAVSHF